jgi:uncharacterized protein (DUF305 family)
MHGDFLGVRPVAEVAPRVGLCRPGDRVRSRRSSVLIGTVLLAAAVGCGQEAPAHEHSPSPAPSSVASSPSSSVRAGFDGMAVAFVQLAIATGDQAVKLLDQGAEQASSSELRTLAADLAEVRRAEVTTLHGILEELSVPYVNNHMGHDMPGMPTDAELSALSASGAGFDAEFTRLLRAHLTESKTVLESSAKTLADQKTKTAARTMAKERGTALERLDSVVAG